jgi:low affinity Fe/Cu permease
MTWILALSVFSGVAALFLLIFAFLIRNFLAVSPARLQREFNELAEQTQTAFSGLRREWADTLDQLTEQAERMAKERQKAQMERGRAEKAQAVDQQQQLDIGYDPTDITSVRRMMKAQGYTFR